MLESFSDDDSFEGIQYHLYVLEKIKHSFERVEAEGAIPHEVAKQRLAKWLGN